MDFLFDGLVVVAGVERVQGEGFDAYIKLLRASFDKVNLRKPKASRGRSREIYALATGFKV